MDTLILRDILDVQPVQRDLENPNYYADDDSLPFTTHVTHVGDNKYKLETSISDPIDFDLDAEIASHLRHDFVASASWGSTDEDLSKLGIHVGLTPDCIDARGRKVLELSTSFAPNRQSLDGAYLSKRLAYEQILKQNAVMYFILVVSPRGILTNCVLDRTVVSKLCQRCRCGMSLVAQVERQSGKVIQDFNQVKSKGYSSIRKQFADLSDLWRRESGNLNRSLVPLVHETITPETEEWVRLLVNQSLEKASERCRTTRRQDASHKVDSAIKQYYNCLESGRTQRGSKRVTIFPMVLVNEKKWDSNRVMPKLGSNASAPPSIYNLWKEYNTSMSWLDQKNFGSIIERSKVEATFDKIEKGRHILRNRSIIRPSLSKSDLDHIALSGPGAKLRQELQSVVEHQQESKKSFSLDTGTDDIDSFINSRILTGRHEFAGWDDPIMDQICRTKEECHRNAESIGVFKWLRSCDISMHANLISEICIELSYEYKIAHREDQWGLKVCRGLPVMILYRCTGSHVFFSLAMDKRYSETFDTGRIGPELYETENYIITDFSSISESGLNHFIKALPYTMSLQAMLCQLWELPIPVGRFEVPTSYYQCLKTVYLLFLNNKLDAEEVVTSLRYFYMNLFQESLRDLSIFTSRLPEVIRSRFTVYLVNKIFNLMRHYSRAGVKRVRLRDKGGMPVFHVHTVRNIFCDANFNSQQLVNSFYFGYVVCKERGRIGERDMKVISKILMEEFWYLDNITEKGVVLWDKRLKPMKHCWDPYLAMYAIDHHFEQMEKVYGNGFRDVLEQDILEQLSKASFVEIATLKASSREEELNFFVSDPEQYKTYKELKDALKKANPTQDGGRPRVITKLFQTVSKYILSTGDGSPSVISIAIWCLKELHKKGYFVADIFPKDQHGGDREIHVLHIYARMAQFVIERISKTIASYFYHDSVVHPDYKDHYYQDHQKRATTKLGRHYTLCKSADATRWCQRNTPSQFYFILARYCPCFLEPYLYCFFFLWTRKRIQIPVSVVANMQKNKGVISSNDYYNEFRRRFYLGSDPFPNLKQRNTAIIQAGMWQGILHRTSTLKHSIIQNFWKDYAENFLTAHGIECTIDVIQGSDDSAALISTNDPRKTTFFALEKLLEMKEILAEFFSIWKSTAKSSVGTINMIEYNSEWIIDNAIIKPTTRWAFATLETVLVERFVTRQQIFYGTLQQTLEAGGSTFLCSLLQMSQAYMHYMLIGCKTSILAEDVLRMISRGHHVALGFFPLDTDMNAGLTGLDFLYFRTQTIYDVATHSYLMSELSPQALIDYEGKISKEVHRDLGSTRIPFSNYRIWNKLLDEMGVGTLESLIKRIEENPRALYLPDKNWLDQQMLCTLKLYQPGVRESLSSHQPSVRMAASSAYVITRPCVNLKGLGIEEKKSLYHVLLRQDQYFSDSMNAWETSVQFPNQEEYSDFNTYLNHLIETYFYQTADMKRTGKYDLLVWGSQQTSDVPVLDLCIRAWWDYKSIKISNTMFTELWRQSKAKYPFLRDSESETKESTNLNSLELMNFLKSISSKTRRLKLQDVPAKGGGKEEVLTRVYWPSTKVRSAAQLVSVESKALRHELFTLFSFPFKTSYKRKTAIDLLTNAPFLARRFIDLPRQARRMKIFRDFLVTGNLINLISQILQLKKGVVGFFTQRQDRKGKGKTSDYVGVGEWRGKICGVGSVLKFKDDVVHEIQFERLTDFVELARTTNKLVKEFGFKSLEIPSPSKSGIYLKEGGKFESLRTVVNNSFPVTITQRAHIDVFDAVSDYDWKFKVTDTKMRITCTASLSGSPPREMTVLSDFFTNRDWDPMLVHEETGDDLFYFWKVGKPVPISLLVEAFGVLIRDDMIENKIYQLSQGQYLTNGDIDIGKLARVLWRGLSLSLTGSQLEHVRIPETGPHRGGNMAGTGNSEDDRLFQLLCEFEDIDESIMETLEGEKWGDVSSDSEEDGELDPEDLLTDAMVEHLTQLFFIDQEEWDEAGSFKIETDLDLPDIRNFMMTVVNWLEGEDHEGLVKKFLMGALTPETLKAELKLPQELRLIVSLALLVLIQDKYSEINPADLQKATETQVSMSSFTQDYLVTKSRSDLVDAIQQLEAASQVVTGIILEKFQAMIKKYKLELRAIDSLSTNATLPLIPYWLFWGKLLSEMTKKKIWNKTVSDADLQTIRSIVIADCLDSINKQKMFGMVSDILCEDAFATAWSEVLTPGLCNLLSHGLNFHLQVDINEECVAYTGPEHAVNSVHLKFSVRLTQEGGGEST